jgi:hypothetical protein
MTSDSRSNWITALATVAGVCVAAVALAVTLNSDDDDKADDPAGQAKPPPGSTVATRSTEPEAPAAAPVLWTGPVLLDGTPVGFDSGRPERGNTSTDMSSDIVVENGSTVRKWFGSRLAAWRDTAPPDRDDCVAQIETRGVEEAPIDVGSRFCLRTDGGRYVYIVVGEREGDGYDADVTLWSNA